MALAAGAAATASLSASPSILLVSSATPAPYSRLFPTISKRAKPPPARARARFSRSAAAAASAPVAAAIAEKGDSWRDLCSLNAWVVRDYRRLVDAVGALEQRLRGLTDERLRAKTDEFRARLARGETLADVQAEAFAVVREAARRTLGMRHFDVQIIGGAVLHDGCIAEMKTGEGKTLVSTLAAYLNALTGEGVHVVTVNDYLAQRDAEWMGRVHRFLGLSVGLIQAGMKSDERRANYRCDITYTNNSELGFDYLRDNLSRNKEQLVMRWDVQYIVRDGKALIINELTGRVEPKRRWSDGIHQAVEAKEGLKIQADSVIVAQITYQSLFKLYPKLSGMTGTAKTEEKEFLKMFKMPVIEVPTNLPNIRVDLPIQAFATLRGKWQYVRAEVEAMFHMGRPVLVGTTSVESSEYLSDLLKARNIPHNVLNARPKYAAREAEIVAQAGRKHAITISTNMAGRGTDIILGGNPKMLAKEIIEDNVLPFLSHEPPDVETVGESTSHKGLSKIKLGPSSLGLLAKAAIIEMSHTIGMEKLQDRLAEESETYPLCDTIGLAYLTVLRDCEIHCSAEGAEVKALGGLHVIGTSLHESRRIDNQLRGRAGRQGDPGSTRFMVSLQDEMFRKFNLDTEWAVRLISRITNDEDIAIESNAVVKQLLGLQINAEKYYFNIRKSLVEFDEVLEVQRKHVYNLRQVILSGDSESCSEQIFQYMQAVVDDVILGNVDPQKPPNTWKLANLLNEFVNLGGSLLNESFKEIQEEDLLLSLEEFHGCGTVNVDNFTLPNMPVSPNSFRGIRKRTSSMMRWLAICVDDATKKGRYTYIVNMLRKYFGDFLIATYLYAVQESRYDDAYIRGIEREILLKTLDSLWKDHLVNMNKLSSAVNVRSFGHRNPLEEYKIDGCRFFISMLSATRRLTVESLLHYWSSPMESEEIFNTGDK
uniref:chloroplast protein-transporting ATPase n=1 Tax=Leersia perrieri TaxID=77586 RepID=A0A0D9XQ08_9ORYZ